jgi:CheY-like chemotaxis protein
MIEGRMTVFKDALGKLLHDQDFDFIISDWNMPEMTKCPRSPIPFPF